MGEIVEEARKQGPRAITQLATLLDNPLCEPWLSHELLFIEELDPEIKKKCLGFVVARAKNWRDDQNAWAERGWYFDWKFKMEEKARQKTEEPNKGKEEEGKRQSTGESRDQQDKISRNQGRVMQILSEARFAGIRVVVERLSLNSIRLLPEPVDEGAVPLGASKIGGRPDLPPEMEWPAVPNHPEYPLAFICQVNLPEVAPLDRDKKLPREGLLSFFYDQDVDGGELDDRGHWRVVHVRDFPPRLKRREFPGGLDADQVHPAFKPHFRSESTLPEWDATAVRDLKLTGPELEAYKALEGELHDAQGESDIQNRGGQGVNDTLNRMLGHPDLVQGEMQQDCELLSQGVDPHAGAPITAQQERAARDWTLLLQVDSLESGSDAWGDRGRIYFWVKAQDLKAANFGNTWLFLQFT